MSQLRNCIHGKLRFSAFISPPIVQVAVSENQDIGSQKSMRGLIVVPYELADEVGQEAMAEGFVRISAGIGIGVN